MYCANLVLLGALFLGQSSGLVGPPHGRSVPVRDAAPNADSTPPRSTVPPSDFAPRSGSTPLSGSGSLLTAPPATTLGAPTGTQPLSSKPADATSAAPATGAGSAGTTRAEEQPSPESVRAKNLLADCLAARTGSTLKGNSTDLATALKSAIDRKSTYEIILAYWRLVQAVGEYNFWLDHDQQIERIQAPQQAQMLRRTAAAGSAASLREAELAVMAAQHELAALAQMPVGSLPLPIDRPHVGLYRTRFAEMFGTQGAPSRGRMIDQTIPLRRQAIEARTTAVDAAREAQTAAIEAYRASQTDLATLLACLAEQRRQSSAFLAAVYHYNAEIADYVLNIVPNSPSGAAVVSLLIATPARSSGATSDAPAAKGGTPPAGAPSGGLPGSGLPSSSPLSTPRGNTLREGDSTTIPPARPKTFSSGPPLPERRPADATPMPSESAPAPLPPAKSGPSAPAGTETVVPLEEIKKPAGGSSTRKVERPLDEPLGRMMIQPQALFGALADKKPAERAVELAAALHTDRQPADSKATPLALEDGLRGRTAQQRREILTAYWKTRQLAAQHAVLVRQSEMLQGLDTVAGQRPWSAYRIRAAQLTNLAARLETQASLLEMQAELADRLGLPTQSAVPMPTTIPHAGLYRLQAEQLPEKLAQSRDMIRLVDLIPRQSEHLQDQALAIIEADLMRAALTAAFESGTISTDQILGAIERQTQQTMVFLRAVTDYNCSIGQYALAFLPPQVPGETLITTLVTPKSSKSR